MSSESYPDLPRSRGSAEVHKSSGCRCPVHVPRSLCLGLDIGNDRRVKWSAFDQMLCLAMKLDRHRVQWVAMQSMRIAFRKRCSRAELQTELPALLSRCAAIVTRPSMLPAACADAKLPGLAGGTPEGAALRVFVRHLRRINKARAALQAAGVRTQTLPDGALCCHCARCGDMLSLAVALVHGASPPASPRACPAPGLAGATADRLHADSVSPLLQCKRLSGSTTSREVPGCNVHARVSHSSSSKRERLA